MSEIFEAIVDGNFKKIKRMVKKNPKVVRIKSPHNRWTPLDVAIEVGKLEIAKYLWKKDGRPNFNAYCDGTHTPVHEAARCEHAVTLNWVFENEVLPLDIMLKIKNHDKNTLLDIAIGHGRLEEMAKYLWEKGGRPNLEIYRDGTYTPVHHAACWECTATLKWVFKNDILPLTMLNVKDNWKKTPLDSAIGCGKLEMAKFLFEKGGQPNLEIYYDGQYSPVYWAAKRGHSTTLKWVFAEKVLSLDVLKIEDRERMMTPLEIAFYKKKRKTAALLRRLLYVEPVFLAMQRAKRDRRCVLRRLPDELLDWVVDEVVRRFHLKVVW